MAHAEKLELIVSEEVRDIIADRVARSGLPEATACLLYGSSDDEAGESWYLGVYGSGNLEAIALGFADQGLPLVYEADGVTLAIPQHDLVDAMRGQVLVIRNGRLKFERPALSNKSQQEDAG